MTHDTAHLSLSSARGLVRSANHTHAESASGSARCGVGMRVDKVALSISLAVPLYPHEYE